MTDAKGEARIIVHGKYEGGAPGRYRLCVSKVEADPDDPAQDRSPGTETVSPDTYDLIDPKFGDVETVQEIEIVAGQTNEWTVDVGKAVRIRIPKRK